MWTVLTSEYVWGVITGVVLTAIGTWIQTILTARQLRKAQKDLIKNLCIDTVYNLKAIVDDMVNHRQRTEVIDPDYLRLLDIEFDVFGRNREHMIHLPNPVRENVRKFVNDCAIRRAEIGAHLAHQLTNLTTLADQLQSRDDQPQAQRDRQVLEVLRQQKLANQALDQLATRVKDCADLVNSLKDAR
jgi:hypothetical protein